MLLQPPHCTSLCWRQTKHKKQKMTHTKSFFPPHQKQNKGCHSFRGISFFFFVCDTLKPNSKSAPFVQNFLWNSDNEVPKLIHSAYMRGFAANLTTFEKVYEEFFFPRTTHQARLLKTWKWTKFINVLICFVFVSYLIHVNSHRQDTQKGCWGGQTF